MAYYQEAMSLTSFVLIIAIAVMQARGKTSILTKRLEKFSYPRFKQIQEIKEILSKDKRRALLYSDNNNSRMDNFTEQFFGVVSKFNKNETERSYKWIDWLFKGSCYVFLLSLLFDSLSINKITNTHETLLRFISANISHHTWIILICTIFLFALLSGVFFLRIYFIHFDHNMNYKKINNIAIDIFASSLCMAIDSATTHKDCQVFTDKKNDNKRLSVAKIK